MGYKVSVNELAAKLQNCYAMYEGEPVFIHGSPDNTNFTVSKVGVSPESRMIIDPKAPSFSAATVQAGWCEALNGSVAFITPQVSSGYLGSYTFNLEKVIGSFTYPPKHSAQLYACLMNKHGTFKEALKKLKTPTVRAAIFDRNFLLQKQPGYREYDILYKTKFIGTYDPSKEKMQLRNSPFIKVVKRKLDRLVNA